MGMDDRGVAAEVPPVGSHCQRHDLQVRHSAVVGTPDLAPGKNKHQHVIVVELSLRLASILTV